jgi:choline dehydrogenase
MQPDEEAAWDYIVVGSGAGGGTVAARLAEAGLKVLVLEAGGDPGAHDAGTLRDQYRVPGFHAFASENPAMSRDVWVRHYDDARQRAMDSKYEPQHDGVLYPRAAALGGCTAHNAMIFMLPHDSDWDHIASVTGDNSWRASAMRRYARAVEACRYRPGWRWLARFGVNPTRHGWRGWLNIERAVSLEALGDAQVMRLITRTVRAYLRTLRYPLLSILKWLRGAGDPNVQMWPVGSFEGMCYTPLSTQGGRRVGTRERLREAQARCEGRLVIELNALVTRVIVDATGTACGVEYIKGAQTAPPVVARARREVILSAGSFHTPQLLMLSGIGPAAELAVHNIPVRKDLPRVGRNLQDRYEVAVTHRMGTPWHLLDGARFERGDPQWLQWLERGTGLYASSGAAIGVVTRSSVAQDDPDLFCMALPVHFDGYTTGYSEAIRAHHDRLTWAVLKAHTRNRAGSVSLRSADPHDMPEVRFRYFDRDNDPGGSDLEAVVEAIRLVRRLTAPLIEEGTVAEELAPGPAVDSDAALADYVRRTAWGHHAAGTCAMGRDEKNSVVDSRFRVHGVRGLRVVDASVFPRIPGIFLVSAVYMIAEKAAVSILEDCDSSANFH